MSTYNRSQIRQRIFIVGCPRSGTTLLQGMLVAHPRIKSFPETHFFSMAYPKTRLKRLLTWPALNVQGVLERFLQEIERPDLIPEVNIGLFDRDYEKSFIKILDRLTLEAGKDIWVEKTPRHINFVEEMQKRVSESKFLHIVRNGADVVASLYEVTHRDFTKWRKGRWAPARGLSIDQCIERWNKAVLATTKWYRMPGHHLVKYETLVDRPGDTIQRVCSFLEVEYVPQMEQRKPYIDEIITPDETWKINSLEPIQKVESKFNRVFTRDQRNYILKKLVKINL